MSDRNLTQLQGAAVGCLLGGGTGFLIKGNPVGAIIGCVAGGGAGYLYGDHVAGKKAAYKNQEAYLNAVIVQSTKVRDETHSVTLKLEKEIQSVKNNIDIKKDTLATEQSQTDILNKSKKHQQEMLASGQDALSRIGNEIEIQKHVIDTETKNSTPETMHLVSVHVTELQKEQQMLKDTLAQIASTNVPQEF